MTSGRGGEGRGRRRRPPRRWARRARAARVPRSSARRGRREPQPGPERAPGDRLVYGRNPVRELIRADRRRVRIVHALPQLADASWLAGQTVQVAVADDLDVLAGTRDHQGIVAECAPYPYVRAQRARRAPWHRRRARRDHGSSQRRRDRPDRGGDGAIGLVLPSADPRRSTRPSARRRRARSSTCTWRSCATSPTPSKSSRTAARDLRLGDGRHAGR